MLQRATSRLTQHTRTAVPLASSKTLSLVRPPAPTAAAREVGRRSFASGEQEKKEGEEGGEQQKAPPKAGPGFWATFKKSFSEGMNKKAAEDPKLAEARLKVDEAKEEAAAATQRAVEAAKRTAEEAKKRAEVVEEQTRPARDAIGEKVGQGMGVVGSVAKAVGDIPAVRATGEATMRAAEAVLDAHDAIDRRAEQIEKTIKDSSIGRAVRETLGEEKPMGRVEGKEIDGETMGVAIREETAWERRMRKIRESTFMGPLVTTAETLAEAVGDASDRWGDRVFGENETSVCIAEIKRDDPHFDLNAFLSGLERETIPYVLKAFLENRPEALHDICTERSLSLLGTIIKDRLQKGLTPDHHILDLEEVQLQEARMVDGEPVLLVTFQTQQLHCVRNKKGEIVEGSESTIQQIFYIWAMVRFFPEDPGSKPEWKLHEMAIQHQMQLLT